jgi:hypothetical protein
MILKATCRPVASSTLNRQYAFKAVRQCYGEHKLFPGLRVLECLYLPLEDIAIATPACGWQWNGKVRGIEAVPKHLLSIKAQASVLHLCTPGCRTAPFETAAERASVAHFLCLRRSPCLLMPVTKQLCAAIGE